MTIKQTYSSDGPISSCSSSATEFQRDPIYRLPGKCSQCDGTGKILKKVPNPYNVSESSLQENKCAVCDGTGLVERPATEGDPADEQLPSANYERPAVDPLARPENIGVVVRIVNGIVCPNLQFLLANVLGAVDASIPNKEQNRAVKDIIRKQFDGVWIEIERLCWPNANFCGPDGDYMLHPEPNRAKAYARAGGM